MQILTMLLVLQKLLTLSRLKKVMVRLRLKLLLAYAIIRVFQNSVEPPHLTTFLPYLPKSLISRVSDSSSYFRRPSPSPSRRNPSTLQGSELSPLPRISQAELTPVILRRYPRCQSLGEGVKNVQKYKLQARYLHAKTEIAVLLNRDIVRQYDQKVVF